jgi:hypothetical protein
VITIIGVLLDELGHGQRQEIVEGPDGWPRVRTRSWSTSAAELRREQPSIIPICLGHDLRHTVGEVVALWRDRQGAAWALAQADADELLGYDGEIYYSAGYKHAGVEQRTDVRLRHVALTTEPAQVVRRPVQLLPGDLSSRLERGRWRLPEHLRERVDQAAEELRHRRAGQPLRVHDPPPKVERAGDGAWLVGGADGELVSEFEQRPAGPLRRRAGRILRVR